MLKNVAGQKWTVLAFNATNGNRTTGDAANITAKVAQDDGTAAAVTDTNPTEVEDGKYRFDLTQAETNGNKLELFAESSTASILVIGLPEVIYTRPANFQALGIEADGDITQVNTCVANTDMRGTEGANTTVPDNTQGAAVISHGGAGPWAGGAGGGDATEAKQDQILTQATLARKILEADKLIDTTTNPWQLVLIEKGTGPIGTGTELLRQNLQDLEGNNVTDGITVVAQMESP
jgi:hypothetical protein